MISATSVKDKIVAASNKQVSSKASSNQEQDGSYLAEDLEIDGDVSTKGALEFAGKITGDISGDAVTLTSTSRVQGKVKARELTIDGHLNGSLAADKLLVRKDARVTADFEYGDLSVELGAVIDGHGKPIAGD
ncbi:polymer-forming cytoskeletal protein [Rhodobacterales bacterium HKCCSP123]|nr:polymer-forming cytoskeletal protein [Rhodobacterales bacterium HKCCSP123]